MLEAIKPELLELVLLLSFLPLLLLPDDSVDRSGFADFAADDSRELE